MQNLITIKEASIWASNYIGKNVSPANISYLIQYARVAKKTHNKFMYNNCKKCL